MACGWLELVHRHDDSKMVKNKKKTFSNNELLSVNVSHQLKTLSTLPVLVHINVSHVL